MNFWIGQDWQDLQFHSYLFFRCLIHYSTSQVTWCVRWRWWGRKHWDFQDQGVTAPMPGTWHMLTAPLILGGSTDEAYAVWRFERKRACFAVDFILFHHFQMIGTDWVDFFLLLFGLKTCFWGHMGPISKSYGATLSVFSIFGRQVKLWSCQTVNWCKLQFSWCSRTFAECPFCEFLRRETNRSLLLHSGSAKTFGIYIVDLESC